MNVGSIVCSNHHELYMLNGVVNKEVNGLLSSQDSGLLLYSGNYNLSIGWKERVIIWK